MFPKTLAHPGTVLDYSTHYSDVVKAKATAGIVGGKATHAARGSSARFAKAAGCALYSRLAPPPNTLSPLG